MRNVCVSVSIDEQLRSQELSNHKCALQLAWPVLGPWQSVNRGESSQFSVLARAVARAASGVTAIASYSHGPHTTDFSLHF